MWKGILVKALTLLNLGYIEGISYNLRNVNNNEIFLK